MNEAEVITAVKASYEEVHMDVPLDAIVRRGRRLRARRRLPGLAGAAAAVAALALAATTLVPGGGEATAPGGSTATGQLAAWTVVKQNGSVKVTMSGWKIRDVSGLQDRLRSDGIPARVAHIGYLRNPLKVPGCYVFRDSGPDPRASYARWLKIFYGRHTGEQSDHAFWVYPSAIPPGLGVLVDIYYDGTHGLYLVKASPRCTGT